MPRIVHGLADLANGYDVILCDVWGVLHDGAQYSEKAADALARFRTKGGKVALITNSPNPSRIVRAQLELLGVPANAYDAIVSSGDVTLSMLAERAGEAVFHLGPPAETALFDELLAVSGKPQRRASLEHADFVLCTGLVDPYGGKPSDYDPILGRMLAKRLDFICANPDIVVEIGGELSYCAGAIAERYAGMGGKVIEAGKPYAPIYDKAMRLISETNSGVAPDRSRVLAIGDAMHTDIKGARAQKFDSLLVASGLHREQLQAAKGAELARAVLRQFVDEAGFAPTAAIPELVW
ncbi:TIGR01459 family HAD-type hydrolase [Methylocapsa palsarum]|uniref:HAD-superfamily class IIA hydrolase, TIGR01459 n=1 Tax=Methylocapsa palsarum TaxID=1612308 RepID=A0A1I3Y4Z0_9HYPH|nr:TIGR01459 family HAD-type hydrolase [Methylocapsa palsarum]SFK26823.1 HAD-superfamily class IIA hydrolase, TIGR01459 [Methylocapsa palsarum]